MDAVHSQTHARRRRLFLAIVIVLQFSARAPGRFSEVSHRVSVYCVNIILLAARFSLAGLLNVMLGVTLILLIQLNYAIGPRLPILSRL